MTQEIIDLHCSSHIFIMIYVNLVFLTELSHYGTVMGKSQIKSRSKISNLLHWRFKSSSQISNLESNLTAKSWILKLQISNQISNPETKRL